MMENPEKILQAGLSLFAERGYDAVGIQEIVDAAGITKPTLYHYFGSKEGLLESILADSFTSFFHEMEQHAVYDGDVKNSLERTVRLYFRFASTHSAFYRFQLSCWFAPPESAAFQAIQPYGQKQYALLEELFRQAAMNHGNMIGRQKRYAASFLGLINTYIGLTYHSTLPLDELVVTSTVHQFMHGIFS
jgi:TetR/AcrR family transcriptional regulator